MSATQSGPDAPTTQQSTKRVRRPDLFLKVIKDCFTGPDGETYAIGRIMAVPMLMSSLGIPVAMMIAKQTVSLAEMAVYVPAVAGAFMLLVTGTHMTEPKG